MKYYDITLPMSPASITWPGHQPFVRQEKQTSAIVSLLTMNSHAGTHVDAQKHYLFDKDGIDRIPLDALVGQFTVFAINAKDSIKLADVKKLPVKAGMRILFKTRNSDLLSKKQFTDKYVSLSPEAARYLATKKIKLVGTDYLGIEAKGAPGHPTHKALLSKKIAIAEGLNLKNIKPGVYSGAILPLLITNGDGAPARAVLWR